MKEYTINWVLDDVLTAWNDYQLEMINKFYGGELTAKKPLPLFYTRPGAIIVPGLAGTFESYNPCFPGASFRVKFTDDV